MFTSKRCAVLVGMIVGLPGSLTLGATYSGSLLYQNGGSINTGLDVFSGNPDGWTNHTEISWLVSDEQPGAPASHPWFYEYTITVRKYALSHLIVELSEGFGMDDILNLKANGADHLDFLIGVHSPGPGNPDMPEALYGLKFNDLGGGSVDNDQNVTHVLSFFSNRQPVWGDAYLKCGGFGNYAYNSGFTVNDTDPDDDPANGSIQYHLLVPDTVIPEPATLALLALVGPPLIRRWPPI